MSAFGLYASSRGGLNGTGVSRPRRKPSRQLGHVRGAVAADYGTLDEKIMRDFAPVVPLRYLRNFAIYGPKIGNAQMSPLWAHFNLAGAFVKA